MTKHHYKVDIRWSDEDQVFVARVPELDGVITHGENVIEAAKMAEDAIALHLESLKAHGNPIPKPAALQKLSGQYPLRMGVDRHQDVVIKATRLGLSVNEYLTSLIDHDQTSAQKKAPKKFAPASKRSKKKLKKHA